MSDGFDLEGVFIDDGTDPLLDDTITPPPKPRPSVRSKPARSLFARVWLTALTDRAWDELFPPRTRLWLFLLVKSKEGRRQVKLTNKLAAEIGLSRFAKSRALAYLEGVGLVAVVRPGNEAPTVAIVGTNSGEVLRQPLRGVAPTAQGCCSNRSGVLRQPLIRSGAQIYYISTPYLSNESYRGTEDAPPERRALFDLPNQPLDPRLPIPELTVDAVYDRAAGACEQCACDAPLELHHEHYNSQGEEEPEDLQALCRDCHESRHRDTWGEFWIDPVELRQLSKRRS